MSTVWMNQLSWVDYEARLKLHQPAILLPVGALEKHRPPLPLGTDGLRSAEDAADDDERIRDVRQGPDGYLYVLTDERNGKILRVSP